MKCKLVACLWAVCLFGTHLTAKAQFEKGENATSNTALSSTSMRLARGSTEHQTTELTKRYGDGFMMKFGKAFEPDYSSYRPFYIERVQATIPDSASIGTLRQSFTGVVRDIYVKKGISKAFQELFTSKFPKRNNDQLPVTISIDLLKYIEPGYGHIFEAELTFYKYDLAADSLKPFFTASLNTKINATRSSCIEQEIERGIRMMSNFLDHDLIGKAYYSDYEEDVMQAAEEMDCDTVHYGSELTQSDNINYSLIRSGIYLSEIELITNRPFLKGEIKGNKYDEFTILKNRNNKKSNQRFMGFSFNGEIYINSGLYADNLSRYARVLSKGRYLVWRDDFMIETQKKARSGFIGLTRWGNSYRSSGSFFIAQQFSYAPRYIGTYMSSSYLPTSSLVHFSQPSSLAYLGAGMAVAGILINAITKAAAKMEDCIAIDTQTGALVHVTQNVLREILADTPDLLADYEKAEAPEKSKTIFDFMVRYNKVAQLPTEAKK